MAGDTFDGTSNSTNTVFCLFDADAPGLDPESFPSYEAIHYGTQPGRRYPACGSPPIANRARRKAFIRQRMRVDLGVDDVDPATIDRILWELENGADGPGIARIMRELAARSTATVLDPHATPTLPVIPDLTEAINFGAVDSRGVLAIVGSEAETAHVRTQLAQLLHEPGIAGRLHAVVLTEDEWLEARARDQIQCGDFTRGVAFLQAEPYGRRAVMQQVLATHADIDVLRRELRASLAVFRASWSKPDRTTQLKAGLAQGIRWKEWVPGEGSVVELTPDDSNDFVVKMRTSLARDGHTGRPHGGPRAHRD